MTHPMEKRIRAYVADPEKITLALALMRATAMRKELTISEVARLGGLGRAAKLTPAERTISAHKAAAARWAGRRGARRPASRRSGTGSRRSGKADVF